jgi:hypothetical protein
MQSAGWVALIQQIPAQHYDNLIVMTTNGVEIAILNVLCTGEEFLVIRGRMSGTDAGRILILPFDRIAYLGFHRGVKEADARAIFGVADPAPAVEPEKKPPVEAVPAPAPAPAPVDATPPPAPSPAPEPTPPPASSRSRGRVPLPDKNAMLERLRARSKGGGTFRTSFNK